MYTVIMCAAHSAHSWVPTDHSVPLCNAAPQEEDLIKRQCILYMMFPLQMVEKFPFSGPVHVPNVVGNCTSIEWQN